jgi:tetratricopeptide (TPR) repeat protein
MLNNKWMIPAARLGAAVSLLAILGASPAHAQFDGGAPGAAGGSDAQQGGMAGSAGASSPGFEGQPDTEPFYQAAVARAKKKGPHSLSYAASLLDLGMHYNRAGRFIDASRVLNQSLILIDGGILKPSSKATLAKEDTITTSQSDGVASATMHRVPKPYEEFMETLLPALIGAEVGAHQFKQAEAHIKRLIAMPATNPVSGKLNLAQAYSQYAIVLRATNRAALAKQYEKKAEDIHNSFTPL